jgi:cyanamide hydratase family protein with HD domain
MPFPKTFDAYIPSNTQDFFALTKVQADYVPFETLRSFPLDPAHAASREYSKEITPPEAFLHSLRCYYFALAILHNGFPSETPGVPQITFEELNRRLYHTCLLHDLGWTTTAQGRAHPAHAMTFELHGGIMAYDHLHAAAPSLDAEQVGDIVQSIALHTTSWSSGKSSATGALMSLSAWFDVCGYHEAAPGSVFVNRKTVQEIEKEYPRGKFATEGGEVLEREFLEKPNCLLSHFHGGVSNFLVFVSSSQLTIYV